MGPDSERNGGKNRDPIDRFQFGATTRDHLRQEVDETFLRAELRAMNAQRRFLGIISVPFPL
jgi:hypothetical protein